jgi:hypothetical protein
MICFTEVRFTKNLIPSRSPQRTGLFQPFPSLQRSPRPASVPSSLSTKDQSLCKANHKDKRLLLALQNNGSQYSTLKWSQEVAHTFSQWFSHGTITNHTWVALSCLISVLWHLWGFNVYRSVSLVDRSEYPTLVYDMDQWIFLNGLVGVDFIALNHPYSRYGASAKICTSGRSRLGPKRSATLQWSDLTLQWLSLTTQWLDQRLSSLGDDSQTVYPWFRTVRASSKNPSSQLITFGLKQINKDTRSTNYSRTVHDL